MKRLLISLIILFSWQISDAQKIMEYRVIRVFGTVEDEVTKKPLKTNDVVPSNHKLKFGSKESRIILLSAETGRRTISGVPDSQSRELLDLFKHFLEPEQKATASRSIIMEYLESLQASLAYDTLLVLSPGYFPVNTAKLPLGEPAAIKAWYPQNKKVQYFKISDASGFRLDKASIFGENSIDAMPRVVIEYFDDEKLDPIFAPGILIGAFVPVYGDEDVMVREIAALKSALGEKASTKKIFEEIHAYLSAEYAAPQEDNLRQWLMAKGLITQ